MLQPASTWDRLRLSAVCSNVKPWEAERKTTHDTARWRRTRRFALRVSTTDCIFATIISLDPFIHGIFVLHIFSLQRQEIFCNTKPKRIFAWTWANLCNNLKNSVNEFVWKKNISSIWIWTQMLALSPHFNYLIFRKYVCFIKKKTHTQTQLPHRKLIKHFGKCTCNKSKYKNKSTTNKKHHDRWMCGHQRRKQIVYHWQWCIYGNYVLQIITPSNKVYWCLYYK